MQLLILTVVIGSIGFAFGVGLMCILSARTYDRGYGDGRADALIRVNAERLDRELGEMWARS